jgi:hypothetical protein
VSRDRRDDIIAVAAMVRGDISGRHSIARNQPGWATELCRTATSTLPAAARTSSNLNRLTEMSEFHSDQQPT